VEAVAVTLLVFLLQLEVQAVVIMLEEQAVRLERQDKEMLEALEVGQA
jgi:hypothetical protein